MTVNSLANRGANLCQDRCVNGLPCISSSGGPLPPCTVTIVAPLVFISLRLKPSINMKYSPVLLTAFESGATHHVAPAHDFFLHEILDLVRRAGERRADAAALQL